MIGCSGSGSGPLFCATAAAAAATAADVPSNGLSLVFVPLFVLLVFGALQKTVASSGSAAAAAAAADQ